MEKYLYNSYKSFFNARKKLGYVSNPNTESLLIMTFIYRLVFEDYRGIIKEKDYHTIEKAINCLYGKSCLLPYRDYLKMGKLKIGEYAELCRRISDLEQSSGGGSYDETLVHRVNNLENNMYNKVVKVKEQITEVSDIQV